MQDKLKERKKRELAKAILQEILAITEKELENFIVEMLKSIKPEHLKTAIEKNIDPFDFLISKIQDNPYLLGVTKFALKKFWKIIVKYLQPKILYNILSQNPENKKLLDTPEGRRWLNEMCKKVYDKLYYWVWLT